MHSSNLIGATLFLVYLQWYRLENSGFSGADFYDRDIISSTLSYGYNVTENWSLASYLSISGFVVVFDKKHMVGVMNLR